MQAEQLKVLATMLIPALLLLACGDNNTGTANTSPAETVVSAPADEQAPAEPVPDTATPASDDMALSANADTDQPPVEVSVADDQVPANPAPDTATPASNETTLAAGTGTEELSPGPSASAGITTSDIVDKPYQLIDGVISANVIEGWKTYNGGGCGTCHGKGGIGAVGPNLADSLKSKIDRETFMVVVTQGKPGTMMRPNSTNKRVMDNLDKLYAYLLARSDGVLGPENLIKYPLGKTE